MKKVLALLMAGSLAACASGGGGFSFDPIAIPKPPAAANDDYSCYVGLAALFAYASGTPCNSQPAGTGLGLPEPPPPAPPSSPFVSWSATPSLQTVGMATGAQIADGLGYGAGQNGVTTVSAIPNFTGDAALAVTFNSVESITSLYFASQPATLQFQGAGSVVDNSAPWAGVSTSTTQGDPAKPSNPFNPGSNPKSMAIIANPYSLGWDYQTFGVWNNHAGNSGVIIASSFGAPTPFGAIPATGTATFTGKLGGFYISPAGEGALAFGNLNVNVNFSARTLNFSSTSTVTSRDQLISSPAPHLNLTGTLSYAPNSGNFNGTLTNASGSMSGASTGQFFGPAAQELGGRFKLRSGASQESFIGGYGARR